MLLGARQYQAQASAPPGSSRGTRVGFLPPGDDSVWELPFSMSLPFFGEHRCSPALCPLKLVASFPLISVAGEAKCLQYSPPLLPSQQTTCILPSTRLFWGSMGRQDDELVLVVTVALSITADIPGGHVSQRLIKAGKFNKEGKTVICNEATPKPQSCGVGRTFPDLQRPLWAPAGPQGHQHRRCECGAEYRLAPSLLLLWGFFPLPFHQLISSRRAFWINTSSWGMISFPAYLS